MLQHSRLAALLLSGTAFGALWAAPIPAVAAQVEADEVATEATVTEATVTEAVAEEPQPLWTFERLVSEVAARNSSPLSLSRFTVSDGWKPT